jgi:hypothetical protein
MNTVHSLAKSLLIFLATVTCLCLALPAKAVVTFRSITPPTAGGTAPPGGTLTASITFAVDMGFECDAIDRVEIREGTTVLAFRNFTVLLDGCGGGDPRNELRTGTISAQLGASSSPHRIKLWARSYLLSEGETQEFVVNVVQAPTVSGAFAPSPLVAGRPYQFDWQSSYATSVSYACSPVTTGSLAFVGSGSLVPPESGSIPGTALSAWVGAPSNCTLTAVGPFGDSSTFGPFVMTTVAPPVVALTAPTDLTTVQLPASAQTV